MEVEPPPDPPPDPPSDCPIANFVVDTCNMLAEMLGRKTRLLAVVPRATMPWDIAAFQSNDVNIVDCALALPYDDAEWLDSILEVGTPKGVIEPEVGMKIKKSGRTTALTHDECAIIDASAKVQYQCGVLMFEHQCVTKGPMSAGGDSGSIILTEDNHIVGLLFAGSSTITIFNRFSDVKEALQLDG